jgi:hypothetical protein
VQKIIKYIARSEENIHYEYEMIIILLLVIKIKYPLGYLHFLNRNFDGIKSTLKKLIPDFDIYEDLSQDNNQRYAGLPGYFNQLNTAIVTYCTKPDRFISNSSNHPSIIIPTSLDYLDCKTE